MKALSVKQPWITLIQKGLKTIETRTWYTEYRGDLLLVSSRKPVYPEILQCPQCYGFGVVEEFDVLGADAGKMFCPHCGVEVVPDSLDAFLGGKAMCIASVVDCRSMTESDEPKSRCKIYPGAYSWVLENIRPIEPFEVKGQLGIYEVNINREQLKIKE